MIFSNSLELTNFNPETSTIDVYMANNEPVAGFQFGLSGVNVTGVSGGSAEEAGFTVSTSSTTVLGFSFTGSTIPSGCGLLTTLILDGDAIGLSGIVVSDSNGESINFNYFNFIYLLHN